MWEELGIESDWFVGWFVKKSADCGATEEEIGQRNEED